MREIWIKRLKRNILKETRPGAAMKRAWLAKLKKRIRLQPAAEPKPRNETVEQEAVEEKTAAQKTVKVVPAQRESCKSVEVPSGRPRQPRTATSFRPEIHVSGEISFHTGTDIAAPEGTPILVAADGVVTIANSTNPHHSYGYYIKLQHGDGFETLYAHCSALCVKAGQEVQQGEVIGFVGSTGDSTGNHLHFEVWVEGVRVDVMDYFVAR